MFEKVHVSALLTAIALLGGCKSTSLQSALELSDEPSANDIYQGTVGFCPQSFESITEHVGNSARQSPEERKASKDRVWSKWQEEKLNMKSNVVGKQYVLSHPAGFTRYNEETGLMELYKKGSTKGRYSYEQSAIPETIVFNTYDFWFSPDLPIGWGPRDYVNMSHKLKLKEAIALEAFGGSLTRSSNVYVINDFDTEQFQRKQANYGGSKFGRKIFTEKLMSVSFNTKKWFEKADSPILFKDGMFYLDTNKVDIYETFGIYPDIGTPYVDINYTVEFVGCDSGQLQADVKEVRITSLNNDNEIYRITL